MADLVSMLAGRGPYQGSLADYGRQRRQVPPPGLFRPGLIDQLTGLVQGVRSSSDWPGLTDYMAMPKAEQDRVLMAMGMSGVGGSIAKIHRFLPKNAVLRVQAGNANPKAIGINSGTAYLRPDGRMLLDGKAYSVGDTAYLYKNRFYDTPPEGLLKDIERAAKEYIETLIDTSKKINRNAIVPNRKSGLFDYPDTSTRYKDVYAGHAAKVDKISKSHDPEAIRSAIINEKLEEVAFKVGNYLHSKDIENLSPLQIAAIEQYRSAGGQLGKSIIDMLGKLKRD